MSKDIIIVGGGFAGLWAALAAARHLELLGIDSEQVRVTLINRDAWHCIRVRNYEDDISDARLPLADVLEPASVRLVIGEASRIDLGRRVVSVQGHGRGAEDVPFDRLVLASGSRLSRPATPGVAEHTLAIDTWSEAAALQAHIRDLPKRPQSIGRDSVLVVGAGHTGIELACEMPEQLRKAGIADGHVILADHKSHLASDMTADAAAVVATALSSLGVAYRGGVGIASVDANGATLSTGERINAETVVWTAGMQASDLAATLPVQRDALGRVTVDASMRVDGLEGVLAAGDIAAAPLVGGHTTVMSCQFGRPMGRFAGHNAVADLLERETLPMNIERYVTCLDLGPWGALLTEGWERRLVASGAEAKRTKQLINRERIYPPRSMTRRDLLDAAAPIVQAPPKMA